MQCSCTHMQFLFMDNKIDFKCMPILVEKNLPILIERRIFGENNEKNLDKININLKKD